MCVVCVVCCHLNQLANLGLTSLTIACVEFLGHRLALRRHRDDSKHFQTVDGGGKWIATIFFCV